MAKYKREELEKLTVKELRAGIAKELNIVGRHDMKKDVLIAAILGEKVEKPKRKPPKAPMPLDELMEIAGVHPRKEDKPNKAKKKKQPDVDEETRLQNKMRYIEGAEIGTIVAFKLPGIKAKSAKIVRKSTKNRRFKVETAYEQEYVISYDDVIWVKTNRRWPKGVYNELKGIEVE